MRQQTRREKRAASRKRAFNKVKQNKKAVALIILLIVVLIGGIGFLMYEKFRPETFRDILGSNYDSIKWKYDGNKETVDDLKRYRLRRQYPGELSATTKEECKFYYKDSYVGTVTFLGTGDMLIYENKIYGYDQNKKEE